MKKLIIFLFLVTLFACDDNEINNCGTNNPLNDIAWLKELKSEFNNSKDLTKRRITQYNYKGNSVFMVEDCRDCSHRIAIVYDCDKNEVCLFGGYGGFNTCPDFNEQATNKKILWEN